MKGYNLMERKAFIRSFAIVALAPAVFLSACSSEKGKDKKKAGVKVQTYTCPMHPQIVQDKPGTCPICAMDLVPFEKNAAEAGLNLNDDQMALANITTMAVGLNGLQTYKQLNGRLVVNPDQTAFLSSRVAGRLEKLYVRQTGEKVRKGQPIYKIYSEQLAALQQEYLLAKAQATQFPADKTFGEILKSARSKLMLYGQSNAQVQRLESAKKTDPYVTYSALADGTVAELSVTEGQYVSEGSPIMRMEGYHSLWVEADIYPAEAGSIKNGERVKVVIPGWENEPQLTTIQFSSPALQENSQLIQIRGAIPNPSGQWQPGLQANIFVPSNTNKTGVLSIPVDAVIREGKGMHVWVASSKGKFEPRMVKTGLESADQVEIKEGLAEGDQVVVTGAYLLYSEYILKKGKNPMAGMKM